MEQIRLIFHRCEADRSGTDVLQSWECIGAASVESDVSSLAVFGHVIAKWPGQYGCLGIAAR